MNKVLITLEKNDFAFTILKEQIQFSNSIFWLTSYFLLTSLSSQLAFVLSFRTLGGLAMNQPFLFQKDMFPFPKNHSIIFIPPILITKNKTKNMLLVDMVTCHMLDPICQAHSNL